MELLETLAKTNLPPNPTAKIDWKKPRAEETSDADIRIHGPIGSSLFEEGVEAKGILAQLDKRKGPVTVSISSPGGSLFEALTIYQAIRGRGGVTTVADGIAASAGALIFLAGENRLVRPAGSQVMLHGARLGGMFHGTASDLKEFVNALEPTFKAANNVVADLISSTSDLSRSDADALIADNKDHWYDKDEVLENGMATGVKSYAEKKKEEPENEFDRQALTTLLEFDRVII